MGFLGQKSNCSTSEGVGRRKNRWRGNDDTQSISCALCFRPSCSPAHSPAPPDIDHKLQCLLVVDFSHSNCPCRQQAVAAMSRMHFLHFFSFPFLSVNFISIFMFADSSVLSFSMHISINSDTRAGLQVHTHTNTN